VERRSEEDTRDRFDVELSLNSRSPLLRLYFSLLHLRLDGSFSLFYQEVQDEASDSFAIYPGGIPYAFGDSLRRCYTESDNGADGPVCSPSASK
jgi:hypothetical protein